MAFMLATSLIRPFAFAGRMRPLFDKELRVASRRRRGYALRCAYVLLLMVFIAMVWIPAVQLSGGGAMSRAHMQAAARTITLGIVWFQFIGAQLVAVVLLSTAISEEVYGRTLCVLMTTPLSNRQVVMGKFSSRLFQILVLVATSLPLLAIVRVLGGIPWIYLVVSLCVTAATVVFVGAVSLFFSVLCRRTYVAVIVSILSIAFVFAVLPLLGLILLHVRVSDHTLLEMFLYCNPFLLLYRFTDATMAPRAHVAVSVMQIITCCTLLLAMTAGILACSVRMVKSVALRHAMGEPSLLSRLRRRHSDGEAVAEGPGTRRPGIRRVVGPPMVWKEMTCTLSRRERVTTGVILGIEGLLIVVSYTFPAVMGILGYEVTHIAYVWVLLGLAILFTITASTTVVSRERETRAWPLLLMTSLTDADILVGKFLGVLRRCGLVWLSLLAYVAAFALADCFHPIAILHVTIIILSALAFLSGAGFYFGSRCRRTADAVTANLVLAGTLWCILPIMVQTAIYAMGTNGGIATPLICATVPFAQTFAMVLIAVYDSGNSISLSGYTMTGWGIAALMLIAMIAYLLVSLAFTWRAVRAFRRRVF